MKSYDSLNLELYDAIGSTVDGLSFQVYRSAVLSQLLAMGLIPSRICFRLVALTTIKGVPS